MSMRLFPALLAGLVVAGCAAAPTRSPLPEITFQHRAPIRLAVAGIDVVDAYRPPGRPPNVEHEFATPPARAAARWARDRLRAAGQDGRLRFVILRADVVEVALARRQGLGGTFSVEQRERYDAVLLVRLEARSRLGSGVVTATARRSQSVAEDITLNDRERVWFAMTEALMRELDAQLEAGIRRHLARFVMD